MTAPYGWNVLFNMGQAKNLYATNRLAGSNDPKHAIRFDTRFEANMWAQRAMKTSDSYEHVRIVPAEP